MTYNCVPRFNSQIKIQWSSNNFVKFSTVTYQTSSTSHFVVYQSRINTNYAHTYTFTLHNVGHSKCAFVLIDILYCTRVIILRIKMIFLRKCIFSNFIFSVLNLLNREGFWHCCALISLKKKNFPHFSKKLWHLFVYFFTKLHGIPNGNFFWMLSATKWVCIKIKTSQRIWNEHRIQTHS